MSTRKPSRTEWKNKAGRWTRSLGNRGARIRLFQKRSGGMFYSALWLPGRGFDRKGLHTTDRVEAEHLGKELLSRILRDEQVISLGELPLGLLWERYKAECVTFLDNSVRTREEAEGHAEVLIAFFGEDCDVRRLTQADQLAFTSTRLAGGMVCSAKRTTSAVRARSVEVDLQLLHTMLKWATTVRVRGRQRLLDQHPLAGVKRIREKNPKRPVATWDRFQKTRQTVQQLAGNAKTEAGRRKWLKLELALVLAEATGRRLGSIRQLRWDDVDFEASTIRWRADTDKKGKEWVVPMPPTLRDELRSFRARMGSAFAGLVFPSHANPELPVSRDKFGDWLEAAEKKAGLAKLDGSLWHAYRRAWATSRKDLPAADVAAAGGWKDPATMIRCYQMADDATLLEVMSHSKKIVERKKEG
jgi:integrase